MRRHTRQGSRESATSQRSLPSIHDPILASVLETSIARSRASSLHNLPIRQPEKDAQNHPFRRWLTTLHQRSLKRNNAVHPRRQRWKLNEFEGDPPSPGSSKLYPRVARLGHRKSSSWNSGSTALLAGTRSAFASMSILSEQRHSTSDADASRIPRSRRSNTISSSADIDIEGLRERSMKRRQIIDEIVQTESEYISSLKALDNVRFPGLNEEVG